MPYQQPPKKINKKKEFELFILWRSLPPFYLGMADKMLDQLGFTDPIVRELLQIRTQAEFAEKFDVHPSHLVAWNKKIALENLLNDKWLEWAKQVTPAVIGAHLEWIMKKGDARNIKLWYQRVDGWQEKKQIEHSGRVDTRNIPDDELDKILNNDEGREDGEDTP